MYGAQEAIEACARARRAGFGNLGVDLILGLPGETAQSFAHGLDRVVTEVSPEHISIYIIETEEAGKHTALTRAVNEGQERLLAEDDIAEAYLAALDRLAASGYRHYEISNFCRPGAESRHNTKYWTGDPYLGVGPSAHSLAGGRRVGRPDDLQGWIDWIIRAELETGIQTGDYTLEDDQARAREALVLALRLIDGVDLDRFSAEWGPVTLDRLAPTFADLARDGLVTRGEERIALTRRGLLLANEVFARLV